MKTSFAPRHDRGFTLVELAIVITLLALMLGAASPGIGAWIQNVKTRNVGESILNGLQLARMEAIKRNERVTFWMVSSTTTTCTLSAASPSWMITTGGTAPDGLTDKCANAMLSSGATAARTIQRHSASAAHQGLVIAATAADSTSANCVTFDGLGQIPTTGSVACAKPITQVSISSGGADTIPMDVRVGTGGQARLCYPDAGSKLATTDPRKC